MRLSRLLAPTLREVPADAEVVSHQLLVRAGYIRRVTSGVYSYLPLMWRVLRKISQIVREEMDRAGAQELMLPIIQPLELWEQSGRLPGYEASGLMMKVLDRHERGLALAPTAEEVITDLARSELKSYRQLPANLYQISNKYRDETRPRFGLLRGREFIMKDAYSFHADQACLNREYEAMKAAYYRIFERCGLKTIAVDSDSGAIGGAVSHEFMVLTDNIASEAQQSGENEVLYAEDSEGKLVYAANVEKATAKLADAVTDGRDLFHSCDGPTEVDTPAPSNGMGLSIEILCKQLGKQFNEGKPIPASLICKTLLYMVKTADGTETPALVLIRGDLEVEETKLINQFPGATDVRLASEEELWDLFQTKKGFLGIAGDVEKDRTFPEIIENPNYNNIAFISSNICIKTSTAWVATPVEIFKDNTKIADLIFDDSVLKIRNFVIANLKIGKHVVNYNFNPNWLAQLGIKKHDSNVFSDLAKARPGDLVEDSEGNTYPLKSTRGIEVGNIFQLGTKYSQAMNATFTTESGDLAPFIMGCYGIGVSRVAAAAIERCHDANGIIWPAAIAPYTVIIVPANVNDERQASIAETLYATLQTAGIEVLIDDRDERAGVKFKDADLMGFPLRITVGKAVTEGQVELKRRTADKPTLIAIADMLAQVQTHLAQMMNHPLDSNKAG
jgi:prolyl-tRNA synthetase